MSLEIDVEKINEITLIDGKVYQVVPGSGVLDAFELVDQWHPTREKWIVIAQPEGGHTGLGFVEAGRGSFAGVEEFVAVPINMIASVRYVS